MPIFSNECANPLIAASRRGLARLHSRDARNASGRSLHRDHRGRCVAWYSRLESAKYHRSLSPFPLPTPLSAIPLFRDFSCADFSPHRRLSAVLVDLSRLFSLPPAPAGLTETARRCSSSRYTERISRVPLRRSVATRTTIARRCRLGANGVARGVQRKREERERERE